MKLLALMVAAFGPLAVCVLILAYMTFSRRWSEKDSTPLIDDPQGDHHDRRNRDRTGGLTAPDRAERGLADPEDRPVLPQLSRADCGCDNPRSHL